MSLDSSKEYKEEAWVKSVGVIIGLLFFAAGCIVGGLGIFIGTGLACMTICMALCVG